MPNHLRRNGQTTLANLLEVASLTAVLNGEGPFTVFAPNNNAFEASGLLADPTITSEQLSHTLLYHVVPGNIMSSELLAELAGGPKQYPTEAGATISLELKDGKVVINGYAVVTEVDQKACNGVIHVIDHVLIPPCGAPGSLPTIAERTASAPPLSTLYSLIQARPTIFQGLSSDGNYTVLGPINPAFAEISTTLAGLSFDQVTKVLLLHATDARRYVANDLALDTVVTLPTLLEGQTVDLTRTASGVTAEGEGNTSPAHVILANVQACNGVAHVVDKVLLPAASAL